MKILLKSGYDKLPKSTDDLVYYKWKGTTCVKTRTDHHVNPNTEAQQAVRLIFGYIIAIWKKLDDDVHASWNAFAKNKQFTGYNAFMGTNMKLEKEGQLLELTKDMGELPLSRLLATPGGTGEIICSFETESFRSGCSVVFYTLRKRVSEEPVEVKRYCTFCNVSPFTLSGLDTGIVYHIYGIVMGTGKYGGHTVSSSVAVICMAG